MLKSLGCMNGWKEKPTIYEACQALGHTPEKVTGRHLTYNTYECKQCGYTYSIDSSG